MAVFRVSNQSQLDQAIRQVKGGDSIVLGAGARFNKLEIRKGFDKPVTITSADKSKPGTINELFLTNTSNVVFDKVKFDHTGKMGSPFKVQFSSKVTIKDSTFDGHLSGGFGSGLGLNVKNSSDVAVTGNKLSNFNNGFSFFDSRGVTATKNDITGIRNDGMTFAGIQKATIEGNHFHKFHSPSSLKHKDAIQFWTVNSTGSKEVIIRNNKFDVNDAFRHTIFIGNEHARAGNGSRPHEDFLISGNQIKGTHAHGIGIEHINGVVIRGNTLDTWHGTVNNQPTINVPVINVNKSSANVLITGNKTASVQSPEGRSWKIENNDLTSGRHIKHWTDAKVGQINSGPSKLFAEWSAGSSSGGHRSAAQTAPEEAGPAIAAPQPAPEPAAPKPLPAPSSDDTIVLARTPGIEEHFRFRGDNVDDARSVEFRALDFQNDDTMALLYYDAGTFGWAHGRNVLHVSPDGKYARLDSVIDIAELAHRSDAVEAKTVGRDVVMTIEQDRGIDHFTFKGIADAYNAVNNPALF